MADTQAVPLAEPVEIPPKPALTPPTSEEFNDKRNDSPDLTDLDLESEEEEDIDPSYYYEGGKIPVFEPTMEQFKHFDKYIARINKHGMKSGICKVVAPKEWLASMKALDEAVKTIKVKNPITQEFSGTPGIYTQANIEKQRSYNLPQWKALCEESQHQPPAKRGERRKNTEKQPRAAPKPKPASAAATAQTSATDSSEPTVKRGRGRPPKRGRKPQPKPEIKQEDEPEPTSADESANPINAPPTPTSPNTEEQEPPKPKQKPKKTPYPRSKGGASQAKSVSERRKYNRQDMVADEIDEEAFKDFDYRFYGNDEFTAERCQELETLYWKSLTFAPPMYGADMPGSLFDDQVTSWNVAHLPNLLDVLGQKVPGVNTAYLYLGMWKATFAWHLEDVDLYSINYIHFGAPKQWYSICQEDARKFENAMKSIWPNDAKNCSQFLRHKTYLVSPALLKSQFNIEVNRLVHYEGEFVITFPYGYHSGYNLGYNCAESVNFATESWLDFGKIAKKCDCEADSVWVDPYYIERKWKGEPTPEYYEETDDDMDDMPGDLPSPPSSVAAAKGKGRKRKRDSKATDLPRKVRRIKLRVKQNQYEPCILCPNDMPWEKLMQTDNGRYAHEMCALYTPELYLWPEEPAAEEPQKICGIDQIPRSRWELKCSYCRSKKGTKFQCSAKKCTRAFHATCAAAAGVQVDSGLTSMFTADGEFYYEEDYFRCRFHRPKRGKAMTGDVLERDSLILSTMKKTKPKTVIQMQHPQGDVFAGVVVENRPTERTVVVDVLPEGDRVEVEWKWVLVNDPADFPLTKPSADAKPLPKDVDRVALQNSNTEHALPVEGALFGDEGQPWKWCEFNLGPRPRNALQVQVDFTKADQLWHYVGEKSTEARPWYTEDPAKRHNNPRSNFLELVKPPPQPFNTMLKKVPQPVYAPGVNMHAMNGAMAASRQLYGQNAAAGSMYRPYIYKPKALQGSQSPLSVSTPFRYGQDPPQPAPYQLPNAAATLPQLQQTLAHDQRQPSAGTQLSTSGHPSNPTSAPVHDWRNNYKPASQPPRYPTASSPAPMSPLNTRLADSEQASSGQADPARVARLKNYPYLRNAFLRRPTGPYKSPYESDGQYSEEYTRYITPREMTVMPNAYVPVLRQNLDDTRFGSSPSPTLMMKHGPLTNSKSASGDMFRRSFSLEQGRASPVGQFYDPLGRVSPSPAAMLGQGHGHGHVKKSPLGDLLHSENATDSLSQLPPAMTLMGDDALGHDNTFDGLLREMEHHAAEDGRLSGSTAI